MVLGSFRKRLRKAGSALLVSMAATGLFAGGAIGALELDSHEHRICPEHGELIHAGASIDSGAADVHAAGPAVSASGSSSEKHEHCAFWACLSQPPGTIRAERAGLVFAAEASSLPKASREAVVSGLARYRLAPMNSPPAA